MALNTPRRAAETVQEQQDRPPARVSFPPLTWVVLGLAGLALIGCLGGQLMLIHQQRDIARQQRELARTQLRIIAPLARTARPLTSATLRGLPRARAIAKRADRLTRTTTPLVDQLVQGGLPRTTRALGDLVNRALDSTLPATLRDVLAAVRSNDLVPRAATAARVVVRLDRTQSRALDILKETLELQRQALAVNRDTLRTAKQTRDVARRTESHAASLDEKLAGPLLGTGRNAP